MYATRLLRCLSPLLGLGLLLAADKVPTPKPLDGAESLLDLRYLPENRYSGDDGIRKDHELKLNLYLPPQGGPCPLVMLVHGGGYGQGSKDSAGRSIPYDSFVRRAIARGYACGSLNYVMRPKEIHPQVFYDAEDAFRFLRANAERFRLDPTRFGAVGFSAGGWLLSSIALPAGDLLRTSMNRGVDVAELAAGKAGSPWYDRKTEHFLFPVHAPEPAWPEHYGLLQALSYDFSHFRETPHAAAPATNRWVGEDFVPPEVAIFASLGVTYDLAVLTGDKYRGKGVHVPGMQSPCRSATGTGEVPLEERILQFFDAQFGPEARTPAPEIRPALRVFAEAVTVSMLVPDPAIAIYYTTDGNEPTPSSPRYERPFTVQKQTVVKALAVMPERRPSGVAMATFIPGPIPPRITAPQGDRLPEATVGEPYELRFACDATGPVQWRLAGEIAPYVPHKQKDLFMPVGLTLDPQSGVLSGTPTSGGTFWVQIQVGEGPGRIGSLRNWLLTIHGAQRADGDQHQGEDTHVELVRLEGRPTAEVEALMGALEEAGCSPVREDDGDSVLILVPAEQRAAARTVLRKQR